MKDLITQLKTVCFDKPESIIHSLDLLNFHFNNDEYSFSPSNRLIMIGEQFCNVTLSMDEKIKLLNSIFFDKEHLFINNDEDAPLFLKNLFDKQMGNLNLISIIYQYMLKKLGINFKLWSAKQAHLIKVFDDEKTYVINLVEKGQKAKGKDLSQPPDELTYTPLDQIYTLLAKMADQLLLKGNFQKTLEIYNCILTLFPDKVLWFARRGLLLKNLGFFQDALKDLEKYSSFVSEKEFSTSIQQALVELKGLKYITSGTAVQIH